MSHELKPEIQKTIKRLSTQKNYEVLKNKIRSWITTREMNVTDFIRACRDKSVIVPPPVINKIGMLFSTGKEGLLEDSDTAFLFYLTAGDLGFASANGNVAQYYFDGRAPGGRNLDLAYQYCRKAIELGADKFMLMSEILHERQDYPETIRYLRKIIESKPQPSTTTSAGVFDYKKRIEARKLEIQCLYQSLQRIYIKLQRSHNANGLMMLGPNGGLGGPMQPTNSNLPTLSSSSMDLGMLQSPMRSLQSPGGMSAATATLRSSYGNAGMMSPAGGAYANSPMMKQILQSPMGNNSAPNTPNPRGGGMNTPGRGSVNMSMGGMNSPSPPSQSPYGGNNNYQQQQMMMATMASTNSRFMNTNSNNTIVTNNNNNNVGSGFYEQQVYQHHLPGWFFITEDLEGFDVNACGELTARAEVISLEAEAIKSAFETAESHVIYAKKHKFSEQIISVLMNDKVTEFQRIYETLELNKTMLLDSWEKYIDTKEHIFRRQIITEKRFFNPNRITNIYIFQLAKELYHRRLYDYLDDYLDCDWNTYYRPNEYLNEPLVLTNLSSINYRIPSARSIVVAERSLLETAIATYGRHTGYQHSQKTGWTGDCNNLLQHYAQKFNAMVTNTTTEGDKKESNTDDKSLSNTGGGGGGLTNMLLGKSSTANGILDDDDDDDEHAPITVTPVYQNNKNDKNQMKELLLKEHTYLESIVIGTAIIRYKHHTHPILVDRTIHRHHDNSNTTSTTVMTNSPTTGTTAVEKGSKKKHHKHHHHGKHHHNHTSSTSGSNVNGNNNKPLMDIELRGSNYYTMDDLGDSDDIWHFINRITMIHDDEHFIENEKKLAELIIKFTREGRPILLTELQVINEDITEGDCNHLMKIIYHYFIKRIVPFILSSPPIEGGGGVGGANSGNNNGNSDDNQTTMSNHYDEIPLASGQARALLLLRLGHVSIKELFDNHSSYGIFYYRCKDSILHLPHQTHHHDDALTEDSSDLIGLNNLERLKVQLSNINALYQKAVLETTPHNFAPCIQFWKKHRHGVTIPTYRTLQSELKEVYGGDHDSDDEDAMGGNSGGYGINYERDVYGADDRELDQLLGKLKI